MRTKKPTGSADPPERNGNEVIAKARRHPACTVSRPGKGDHWIIGTEKGSVPIPQREMGLGLACAVRKQLAAIGIALSALLTIGIYLLQGGA